MGILMEIRLIFNLILDMRIQLLKDDTFFEERNRANMGGYFHRLSQIYGQLAVAALTMLHETMMQNAYHQQKIIDLTREVSLLKEQLDEARK